MTSTAQKRSPWDWQVKDLPELLEAAKAGKGESLWRDAWRRLRRNRAASWCLLFLFLVGLGSLLAPLWPLASPMALDLQDEPQSPVWPWQAFGDGGWSRDGYWSLTMLDSWLLNLREAIFGDFQLGHWLGTDSKGRDLMARIVWGSRISIQVAVAATTCSVIVGVTYGAFSGLMGGRIDNLMMRFVDVLYSVPFIFVVIFIITILQGSGDSAGAGSTQRLTVFYLVIGLIYWLTMARVVRGQVLSLKQSEFVDAARVLGASTARILFVHIVPNVLSIVIIYLTLTIPAVMLFEAFLTFLGLGVQSPQVSWGLLAVDGIEAISPIKTFWWLVIFPALAMGSTLLALNILGDGLRDALDPKLRGKD
ncbi:MAG: oligopeptide transport system permease protein [Planctomycetota bacterium]|jgi:oligopeptide transport system permease protein